MSASCCGCKYLYSEGRGYSNYTWLDTAVMCAKERNRNLIGHNEMEPSDWVCDPALDNWPKTNTSRCELYSEGVFVALDVDGENNAADHSADKEQVEAINKHCGRGGER